MAVGARAKVSAGGSGATSRRADLAAIHVAKKALAWDDDLYRDVMATVCGGARSAGVLDDTGRQRLLAHLQACLRQKGVKVAKPARRGAWTPRHMRLWALWQKLADSGRVQQRDRAGLVGWVKDQVGLDDVSWASPAQLDMLIERAKAWLERDDGSKG